MKRNIFTFLAIVMSIACLCMLTGCPSPESPADPVPAGRQKVTGKIGKYGTPYVVGDIVFTDGSATPVSDIMSRASNDPVTGTKMTEAERDARVAYIFYVGTELNNPDATGDDDTTTERTLGVALEVISGHYGWTNSPGPGTSYNDEYGVNNIIEELICTRTGTTGDYEFSGRKNGTENFNVILAKTANETTPEKASDYDGFYYAPRVYSRSSSVPDEYKTGWYLPSIAELYRIWKKKDDINTVWSLSGINHYYQMCVSSSQSAGAAKKADLLNFISGEIKSDEKASCCYSILAIREFPAE